VRNTSGALAPRIAAVAGLAVALPAFTDQDGSSKLLVHHGLHLLERLRRRHRLAPIKSCTLEDGGGGTARVPTSR